MLLPKVLLSDCVISRVSRFRCSVLLVLYVHFIEPQQDRTTLSPLNYLRLAPSVVLVLIWYAFIPSVWRLAIGLQRARPHFAEVLQESVRHAGTIAPVSLLYLPLGNMSFFSSMPFNTANAFDIISRLDLNDTLDDVPQSTKQKAIGLFLDKLHKQDFARLLACRASKVLGPISRHRVAYILPHMKIVSRASRPGLLVGFFRILCNGLYTAEHDHTCRIGCPDEPDSLTHYNACPRLFNILFSFWIHATILPQGNHFLHDLIIGVFLRSLQYRIVVLGFLDAFVYGL